MHVESQRAHWLEQRACADEDTDTFVYDDDSPRRVAAANNARGIAGKISKALSICQSCPVQSDCAQDISDYLAENPAAWSNQVVAGRRLWSSEDRATLPPPRRYYTYTPPPNPAHRPVSDPYGTSAASEKLRSIPLYESEW